MSLPIQPFMRAQLPLAAHWQAFVEQPQLRLGRWLTAEADRPLLHDYLLGLNARADKQLQRLPSSTDWTSSVTALAGAPIIWLEYPGPKAEDQLRTHLASRNPQRLLVLEDSATQPWQRLARWFPAAVHTCTPAVSMQQVLADLRGAASSDEPASCFQQQFHRLTEAIAHADSAAVATCSAACLATCAALPGAGAAVTVWLACGQYFLAQKQADEALHCFASALACAETAFAAGDSAAGLLSVQVWLGEAAAWQQRRRSAAALAALQQAADRAAQLEANLLGVEAARQLGLALDQAGQPRPALASYQRGLALAEQLPAGQRPAPIINALGDAYLKCLRARPDQEVVRARIAQVLA
jgi:tetratricopeptide (TPR) repeat protein